MNTLARKLIVFLFGFVVYAGLPLLSWGTRDIAAFVANPVRATFLVTTAAALILIVVFVPNSGQSTKEGSEVLRRQRFAVLLLQLLPLGILALAPHADRCNNFVLPEGTPLRVLGLVFFLAGTALMNWAAIALGRHFSIQVTVQKDHRLVTDGPFRFIRHPRYLGIAASFFGVALVFRSLTGLILAGLLLLVLLWRIHDEEKFMAGHFPDAWPAYAAKTARLLPFVF